MANGILTTKGHCFRRLQQPKFPKKFKESSCCQLLQDLPEGLVARLNFFREMSSILLPEDEVSAVQDLIILLHETLKTYEALCASRRSLDFIALEQVALQMLRAEDLPELFQRLDRRLTHLLVDEFQDTSVNQMHLLCRLLAGWQGDRQRSLMVVGDPKQSIYGWRQARLELFFKSRDTGRLSDCPESPAFTTLALKTNFRSSAGPDRVGQRGFWPDHYGGPGGQRGGFQGRGRETRSRGRQPAAAVPVCRTGGPPAWRQSGWPGNYCGWSGDSSRCRRRKERPWGCCSSPGRICPFTWRPGAGWA